jgi:hypothetical protein
VFSNEKAGAPSNRGHSHTSTLELVEEGSHDQRSEGSEHWGSDYEKYRTTWLAHRLLVPTVIVVAGAHLPVRDSSFVTCGSLCVTDGAMENQHGTASWHNSAFALVVAEIGG